MKGASRINYKDPGAKHKPNPKYIDRKETHDQYISDHNQNAKTNMHTGNKKHHNSSTFNNSETTANSQLLRESTQKDTESKVTTFNTPHKGGFFEEKRISSPKTTDHSNLLQPKMPDLSNLVETKDHEIQQLEEQNFKIYSKIVEVLDRVREKKDIETKITEKEMLINQMQSKLQKVGQEIEYLKSYPKSRSIADIYNDQASTPKTECVPNFNRLKSATVQTKDLTTIDTRSRKPPQNIMQTYQSPKMAGRSPKNTAKSPKLKSEPSPPTVRNLQSPKTGLRRLLDLNQGHPEFKYIFKPPQEFTTTKKEVHVPVAREKVKVVHNVTANANPHIQTVKTVRRNYEDPNRLVTEPTTHAEMTLNARRSSNVEKSRPEDLTEKFSVLLEKFSVLLDEKQRESKELKKKNKELEKKLKRICEVNQFS